MRRRSRERHDSKQSLRLWRRKPWRKSRYKGRSLLQTPVDLILVEELLERARPGLIVESGVHEGGFSEWLADRSEIHGLGALVVGIDRRLPEGFGLGRRIEGFESDSLDPETIAQVEARQVDQSSTIVFLDDDHSPSHVLRELDVWSGVLKGGDWLIVCDTVQVRGLEAAVRRWLRENPDFEAVGRDRFGLSNHRGGWLRRKRGGR